MTSRWRRRGDDGLMSLELALLTPVLLGLAVLLAAAGYLPRARIKVDAATQDAARAATLATSEPAARAAAFDTAKASLDREHVSCRQLDVTVDLSRFAAGGSVTVDVRCRLDLSWLPLPGAHLPTTMTGTATVGMDRYQNEPAP